MIIAGHQLVSGGDVLDGRDFFMGRDFSGWSWGQGTGPEICVLLLKHLLLAQESTTLDRNKRRGHAPAARPGCISRDAQ